MRHGMSWRTPLLALLGLCCLSAAARAADGTGFYLTFPVSGYTAFTAPASAAFDHSAGASSRYLKNGTVQAYPGVARTTSTVGSNGGCYSNGLQVTLSGINYVGARSYGAKNALCYDGHPGWDYAFATGTVIRAAADGRVYDVAPDAEAASGSGCSKACGTVYVVHDTADTIRTYYLHLSVKSGRSGSRVARGEIIGRSGATGTSSAHLHFEVRRRVGSSWGPSGAYSVDPYGTFSQDPHPKAAQMPSLWTAPATPPAPPSRTFAAPLTYRSVRVGWDDDSGNELGFRVYRWNPAGSGYWALMASLGQNSVSYTDSGLQSSTKYYYLVCSWNAASSDACAAYVSVTTPAPPPFETVFFVDGLKASSRPQGRTFTFTGAGFTPYGQVDRQLYNYATGTWTHLAPQLYADSYGTLFWQYTPPCASSARGDFYVWVYDHAKGKSFGVWETVTPGACN